MRSRKPFLIFWPQYFDAKRTRSEGRRLPKNLAVDKVSAEDVTKAARRLNYRAEIEPHFKYPRTWFGQSGRVAINTKGKPKSKVIKELAKELRKMRTKRRS